MSDFKLTIGKSKYVGSNLKRIVDNETGELIAQDVSKEFLTKIKSGNFFMCFFENFGAFYGLKYVSDTKLIAAMCELADYNTGVVHLTKKVRRELCDKAGISLSNLSKNLKRLLESGLVTEDEGDWQINPAAFWKGSLKTRTEIITNGGLKFNITLVEETQ